MQLTKVIIFNFSDVLMMAATLKTLTRMKIGKQLVLSRVLSQVLLFFRTVHSFSWQLTLYDYTKVLLFLLMTREWCVCCNSERKNYFASLAGVTSMTNLSYEINISSFR